MVMGAGMGKGRAVSIVLEADEEALLGGPIRKHGAPQALADTNSH
jgi:hypothetical protein